MDQTLYDVDESEEVARILFYLSVWRTLHKTPTRENVTFPPRTPGDEVFGYATLNVGIIGSIRKSSAFVKLLSQYC